MSGFSDADLAEGRRLVVDLDRAQWSLGDLALKVAGPPPVQGQHDPNRAALNAFAEAIGIAPARLAEYRAVAGAWGSDRRIEGASWSLHRGLVARDDRADHLAAFLAACHDQGVTPTRERLRTWDPAHPAGPGDELPRPGDTVTLQTTIEACIAEFARLSRAMDDAIAAPVVFMAEHYGVDPADGTAVVAALEQAGFGADYTWRLLMTQWEGDYFDDDIDTDAKRAAIAWEQLYDRWIGRHHPVEADPWEDR